MTNAQQQALHNVVRSENDLQKAWDNPRKFKIPGIKHPALLVLTVIEDIESLRWMAAIRLMNIAKQRLKLTAVFTSSERLAISAVLLSELAGVGKEERSFFTSRYAMHIQARLTGEELGFSLRDEILGSSNGHKPVITRQDDAKKLLDRIEENVERRIILPGEE